MSMTNQTRDIARFSAQAKSLADAAAAFSSRAELALHGVYEISKILAVPARLETTLSNVLTLLSSFLEMRHGMIALLADDGAPRAVVGVGWSEDHAKAYFERLPERAIGQIVATKMPVVIEDVAKNVLFSEWYAAERDPSDCRISFIGVPIKERDKVIGTLTIDRVWDSRANFRLDEDVRFLVMIANLVGQTVRLHNVIGRDRERLMDEQRRLEKELSDTALAERDVKVRGVVGQSKAIRNVMDKIKIVARSNTTVLLRGESGTGKELFAHATHELSPRKKGPFIKLNCAALPESMLESELFGHEKGSFTGAVNQRKGRFELADKGTLFLDEIGEISPAFQAKLLRVLQEGEFERVGGTRTLKVDVRFVFATNKNLEEAVARGEFRSDLYYRINVVSILLPPLRERADDINLLAREFLHRFNDEHGTQMSLTASAQRVLESCYFPGNVRELENCMRRTATLARDSAIVADDFACRNDTCLSATLWKGLISTREPLRVLKTPVPEAEYAPPPQPPSAPSAHEAAAPVHLVPKSADLPEDATELDRLVHAMETAGWVQAKAARILNMTPRQIGYALRKHNIPIKRF
jgi:Nif-specific regulatory protein